MTNQAYGQFCGLSRALEVVGEPWALLVVRDLIVSPKSAEELRLGLPRIPAGVLTTRLEELEEAGIIRRQVPYDSALYELTAYGNELEDVVMRLGRWGAKALGGPKRDEIVTTDSMVMALRTMFNAEAARGLRLSFMLLLGDLAIHACIDDGQIKVGKGPLSNPDLIIEAGPGLKALMAGEMSPRDAIESSGVRLTGDSSLLAWFVELFHIPPMPPSRTAGNGRAEGNGHAVGLRAGPPSLNGHAAPAGVY